MHGNNFRLSSFASKQLTTNNPNIADLSDRNRPTKLGEKFEQLYDNEWSEAFEYLKGIPMDEDQILKTLVDISQVRFFKLQPEVVFVLIINVRIVYVLYLYCRKPLVTTKPCRA